MFPPKKKPAIGVMIGLGDKGDSGPGMPPKYKSQSDSQPNDTPMESSQGKPPKPAGPGMANPMQHEASEPPAQEGGEEYGARLVADIDSVFDSAGIDPQQGRQIASQLFSAVAKCLSGESKGDVAGGEGGAKYQYGGNEPGSLAGGGSAGY